MLASHLATAGKLFRATLPSYYFQYNEGDINNLSETLAEREFHLVQGIASYIWYIYVTFSQ